MSVSQTNSSSARQVLIGPDHAGQRLDNFLLTLLKGVPRSRVYRILRRGEVRINGGRTRAGYRLQDGDRVRVPPLRTPAETGPARPEGDVLARLEAAILYEDGDFMVVNKPSGLAVHGGSGLSYGVIEAIRALRPGASRLELVHRLDRETSGCLLVAKKSSVLRNFHELLRSGKVSKRYLALVAGRPSDDGFTVTAPLRKNVLRSGERVVLVDTEGKPATTRFRVLERFAGATLVEAFPVTGRTHQIRVHAAHVRAAIAGDEKYGDARFNEKVRGLGLKRLFLHAHSLTFRLSTECELFHIEAPLHGNLDALLQRLRRGDWDAVQADRI